MRSEGGTLKWPCVLLVRASCQSMKRKGPEQLGYLFVQTPYNQESQVYESPHVSGVLLLMDVNSCHPSKLATLCGKLRPPCLDPPAIGAGQQGALIRKLLPAARSRAIVKVRGCCWSRFWYALAASLLLLNMTVRGSMLCPEIQ